MYSLSKIHKAKKKKKLYKSHLKHNSYSHYPNEKIVFCNSLKNVKFIWLPGIKFIENLQLE